MYKSFTMRQNEDIELRNFEIRQWFYCLYKKYLREGLLPGEATEKAYDDIGIRFCLRRTSIRKAKNTISNNPQNRNTLMFETKNHLKRLKEIIQIVEKEFGTDR